MQKLPEAPNMKRGDACAKKKKKLSGQKNENRSFSAVTGEVTTLKIFLLVKGAMCLSLGGKLVNISTHSSHLFNQNP